MTTLSLVRWAEQLCGGSLVAAHRRDLDLAQAHLLMWGLVRDRVADGTRGALEDLPDLLPLLCEAQLHLAALFAPGHPFWRDWRRLVREQVETDRWERTAAPPVRFGPALIRRLGRKAALLRWPAAAVPRLLGAPEAVASIDRAFDDLLAVLQLFDDVVDAEEDAAAGQINAVLVAGGAPAAATGLALTPHIARGTRVVHAAIRPRLRRLSQCRGGLGHFAHDLLARCDETERAAVAAASAHALSQLLARMSGASPQPGEAGPR